MSNDQFQLNTATEFILPSGKIIKLKPISTARLRASENRAREELKGKGLRVEPPTYVPVGPNLAPGVTLEPVAYTDATIGDAPEEVRSQYEEYKENLRKITNLSVAYMLTTLILRGTVFDPEDGWEEKQVLDGMVVPANLDEKYVHYMLTEVLIPPVVAESCAKAIMLLSLEGAPEEVIEAFEASFRRKVQVEDRKDPQGG
jgi:hypothetical protein